MVDIHIIMDAIPTLDLSLAKSDRHEAARQLVSALEGPGFLYLKNVKGYDPGIRFAAGLRLANTGACTYIDV